MNRIKELRLSYGWTQPQLGKRIGAARSTISMYEAELRQLDAPTIHALCDLFGCTSDYLLCRSDVSRPMFSDEDARILAAYHAASLRDRGLIDQILAAYMPTEGEKSAG